MRLRSYVVVGLAVVAISIIALVLLKQRFGWVGIVSWIVVFLPANYKFSRWAERRYLQ